jgi:beta-alanine degradation protein BauB
MKKFLRILFVAVLTGISILFAQSALGQLKYPDIVKAAPGHAKVILDNKEVRVISVWMSPGDSIPMHHHPQYTVYAASGGTIKSTLPDGTSKVSTIKTGEATWHEAEDHATQNVGKTKMHNILVEMKKAKM